MIKTLQFFLKANLAGISIILCFVICCQQQVQQRITEAEVNALNERILSIWNDGELALVDEICTPDCVRHDCGLPEDIEGLEAIKNFFGTYRAAFPNMNMSIDEAIVGSDKIVWWWTMKATNLGSMQGLPPTNQEVHLTGVSIARIANGRMAEIWDYYNQATLFRQLGFTMTPPKEQE